MFQIFFNHLVSQLTRRNAEVNTRPKMPTPQTTFQVRKTLKQFSRTPPFDASHDFTRCHARRCRDKKMHMILAHHFLNNLNFKSLASLTYQFPSLQINITFKNLIPIFRNKYKVISYCVNCMTTVAILHDLPPSKPIGEQVSQINLTA